MALAGVSGFPLHRRDPSCTAPLMFCHWAEALTGTIYGLAQIDP
jgi:hypothetical protein